MRVIIHRGIQVAKNCKAVGTKYSRNNKDNFEVSYNNKINGERLYERQVYVVIHRGLSMEGNCKSDGHKGLGKALRSIFRIFWRSKRSSIIRSSPGGSNYENLELELAKPFNPNRREIRVPE